MMKDCKCVWMSDETCDKCADVKLVDPMAYTPDMPTDVMKDMPVFDLVEMDRMLAWQTFAPGQRINADQAALLNGLSDVIYALRIYQLQAEGPCTHYLPKPAAEAPEPAGRPRWRQPRTADNATASTEDIEKLGLE